MSPKPSSSPRATPRSAIVLAVALGVVGLLALGGPLNPLVGQSAEHLPHGDLSANVNCGDCHTAAAWVPARSPLDFDHARQTGFALVGTHADLVCSRCHANNRFDRPDIQGRSCGTCHVDVHQAKLGTQCAACHQPTTFTDVQAIEVHARTFFPLNGAHLELACDVCHANDRRGAFSGRDAQCTSCHLADIQSTRDITGHEQVTVRDDCTACHGTVTWTVPGTGL